MNNNVIKFKSKEPKQELSPHPITIAIQTDINSQLNTLGVSEAQFFSLETQLTYLANTFPPAYDNVDYITVDDIATLVDTWAMALPVVMLSTCIGAIKDVPFGHVAKLREISHELTLAPSIVNGAVLRVIANGPTNPL